MKILNEMRMLHLPLKLSHSAVVCDVPNLFSWSGGHACFLWAGPRLVKCSAHNLFSEAASTSASYAAGPVFCSLPGLVDGGGWP